MTAKELENLFTAFCNSNGIVIDRSRFEGKGAARKYIVAKVGTVFLNYADIRVGGLLVTIARNMTKSGAISTLTPYMTYKEMAAYINGMNEKTTFLKALKKKA